MAKVRDQAPKADDECEAQGIMPLLMQAELHGLEDGEDEDGSDEKEEEVALGKRNKTEMLAAIPSEDYATMQYPIVIGSGAAESVLPRNWCPRDKLAEGHMKGKTYSAANEGSITNDGETLVPMVANGGQWNT
jgi:hypothetical protein